MGYDVGVYNSYGHRTISCSGFLQWFESEPFTSYGARGMSVRSPYDF